MRTLPIGFQALERQAHLRPTLEVAWSARYGGRPTLQDGGRADDGLQADDAALVVVGTTLVQLKARGLAVEAQRRDAATLALLGAGWTNLATAISADVRVGLTRSQTTALALWRDSDTEVRFRRSTDAGATWLPEATAWTATGANTVGDILTSPDGAVGIEERRAGDTALVHVLSWTGTAWGLVGTIDTGATRLYGGGIMTEGGTFAVWAGDEAQTTTAGTVTLRRTRVFDLDAWALRGMVHQGSEGGARWRDPRTVYLSRSRAHAVLATIGLPRGANDASDRVALVRFDPVAVGAHHALGPPRVVYGVEDAEHAAVAYGADAVFVMAGSLLVRLVEEMDAGTVALASLDLRLDPEDEGLRAAGPGALPDAALQVRARAGLGGTMVDLGLWWLGGRIHGSREGWQGAAYGLWGMLRRERQHVSVELREANGEAMTPGHVLELVLTGLGFEYGEEAGLADALHPAVGARMLWTLRYGRDYATLVRGLLRWTGTDVRTGVAADGVTPTARVFRPGSRFGPSPPPATAFGGAGGHPLLEVVSVEPEVVTDVTVFPGGWDHQTALAGRVDRQLMLEAREARDVAWDPTPATRALARALAGAEAGMLRCRPALEVELWDTVLVTDGPGGRQGGRFLARWLALAAGRGRWEMRLGLGLE